MTDEVIQTYKVTRADGLVSYVRKDYLDSVVSDTDTVEEYIAPTERPDPTVEELEYMEILTTNRDAREYLISTDWYVTRQAETGKEVPADILTKRAEARAAVIENTQE